MYYTRNIFHLPAGSSGECVAERFSISFWVLREIMWRLRDKDRPWLLRHRPWPCKVWSGGMLTLRFHSEDERSSRQDQA